MIIRKLFKFEGAHIVRGCYTDRCSMSFHGHSYKVEVFLESNYLDVGGMIADFSIIKKLLNPVIDAFDHTMVIWNKEDEATKEWIKTNNKRWIVLPCTPSAECLSYWFLKIFNEILNNYTIKSEKGHTKKLELHSVRVHETDTGYAESFQNDEFDIDVLDVESSADVCLNLNFPSVEYNEELNELVGI